MEVAVGVEDVDEQLPPHSSLGLEDVDGRDVVGDVVGDVVVTGVVPGDVVEQSPPHSSLGLEDVDGRDVVDTVVDVVVTVGYQYVGVEVVAGVESVVGVEVAGVEVVGVEVSLQFSPQSSLPLEVVVGVEVV